MAKVMGFLDGARKGVFCFAIAVAMLVPVAPALAAEIMPLSWYGSTLAFDSSLTGQTRYYDSHNVGIEMDCYTVGGAGSKVFTTLLYRDNVLVDDFVGSYTSDRNGYNHHDWTGVGSGNYYFRFTKAIDGVWVYSDNVAMFSW